MAFLEEFDRRADAQAAGRKPDEAVPEGESPENRELLDFADLVRARRAAPADSERERVLDRVRKTQAPAEGRGGRRRWLPLAAAALLAVIVGLAFLSRPPSRTTTTNGGLAPGSNNSAGLVADTGASLKGSRTSEEFGNLDFPKPQLAEGNGAAAVEARTEANTARLTRVHGLAIFQALGEKRWRVAARGQALHFGDTVRTSKRLDSSVRILAPDGSAVSLGAGSVLVYGVSPHMGRIIDPQAPPASVPPCPRAWSLKAGVAFFEVARSGVAFLVESPHAVAQARGTRFQLAVSAKGTLCSVDDGSVALRTDHAASSDVAAGQAALADGKTVVKSNEKSSADWLKVLEAEAASDYGIGALVAKAEKANERLPLEIKSHTVTVTVVDQVARTFVDEIFINNTDRRLEGTFYYPLPPDASISEFAMYVNDQRIVGEVLEQQRARQIFEYIVRQQRDPALLEYAGGNLFKMRVFPIEPHSEKRIQLGYTQILPRSSGKVIYTYPLYSEKLIKNPLHDLKIEFRVVSSPGLSNLASPTHQAPSAISADGKRGALAFRAKSYSPTRDFTVTYSVPDGAECVAFANVRPDDGGTGSQQQKEAARGTPGYFMLQLCPNVQLPRRDPPQRLLVIVDGSASAGAQEYAVATEFAASAADVSGDWQFSVLRGGQKPQTFGALAYADTDTSTKVRDFLQKSQPLGATDLLETFRQAAASIKADEGIQIVYVGDGIDTVSELSGPALAKEIAALFKGKDVKVSTVAVGSSYDRPVLQSIAAKLGGTFSRVEGAADVHAAVGQVFDSFYRPLLWDVMVNFEEVAVSAVYPEFLGTVAAGDTAVVVGRVANPPHGAKGRVKLVADQGGQLVERGYNIDLSADEANNRFLPRLWAKAHIDALLGTMGLGSATGDARTKQDVIKTSIDYQIMSPFTAFLVLESEEDYARFGIKRTLKKWDWTGNLGSVAGDGDSRQRFGNEKAKEFALKSETSFTFEGVDTISGNDSNGLAPTAAPMVISDGLARSDEAEKPVNINGADEDSFLATFDGDLELEDGLKSRVSAKSQTALPSEPAAFGLEEEYTELGDHFETDKKAGLSLRRLQQAEKEVSGGFYYRSAGRRGRAYGWGGGGGGGSYGRRGFNYPQYTSLVFHGGKVPLPQIPRPRVEIRELEVDQPLRPLAYYQRLAASGKGTLSTQLNLSLALEQAGRFDEAMKALVPVIREFPTSADVWLQYGCLRYRSGDPGGCMDAFEKALPATWEDGWPAKNERVASLLGSLGQYAKSADQYAALARAAAQPENAQRLAVQAASHYQSAGHAEKGWALWEELLKRWPNDAKVMAGAGMFAANNGQFERGVELIRAARKLDPNATADLIGLYAQRGLRTEALDEFRGALGRAKDANQILGALSLLSSLGTDVAAPEALKLLAEGSTAAQITGATQYLQGYGALRGKAGAETLVAAVQRKDFPAQARINAFYALQNARQRWGGLKLEPAAVLAPLCEDPRTQDDWNLASQALSVMVSYGCNKEALEHAQRLQRRNDVPEGVRPGLVLAEFNALTALGRQTELGEKALQVLAAAKDEHAAYSAMWQAFWARLNRNEIEGAAQIAEAYGQRFPNAQYLPQFYSYLMQRLQQNQKKDEAAALVEKLAKAYPENAVFLEMRARVLASQGKFRDAAESVRAGIKALSAPAAGAVPPAGLGVPPTGRPDTPVVPPAQKADEKKAEQEEAKQRAEQRRAQRDSLIRLLAQLCAQDAELRAAFLKEADANATNEHPAFREWTEAALACVNAAGDVDAYLKRLQALAQAEPNDPLWARRFGYALLSAKKYEAARPVLGKLSDTEPDDVELALSLQNVCVLLKDAPAAEKYFTRAFDALSRRPNELQQYASQWQQQKPDWALKAWMRLKDDATYANRGHAAYLAAQACQQLGREKDATELFFTTLSSSDGNYASAGLQGLLALARKEEHLRAILPQTYKALEGKPAGSKALYLNLLVYNLEKLRASQVPASTAPDAPAVLARAALDRAAALDLPEHEYNAGTCVVTALAQEKLWDRVEKYVLEGGGKLSPDARRNLIRQTVNSSLNQDDQAQRARALRLFRSLLATPDANGENDRRRLVELLIQDGQLAAAEAEVRAMPATQNSWVLYDSWRRLVEVCRGKRDYAHALTLALDAWQALENDTSYCSSAREQFTTVCSDVLGQGGKLDDALRKRAMEKVRESATAHFAGEAQHESTWSCNRGDLLDKLGLRDEVAAMVREAGASNDPRRVVLAAAHIHNANGQVAEAKRLYRRALTLPGADERNIYSQLYNLCAYQSGNQKQEWGDAIELLEKLKTLHVYNEEQYLAERGRCLYGLKRPDEARAIYRTLMARPTYWQQGYWQMQNLAHQLEQDKDWTMAAEAWELAIKLLRRQSRGQLDASTAAQFYQACAQAYSQLGEKDKALDCFLRGMSVIPRSNNYYQQILEGALKQVLRGEALDKTVEEYEKNVTASGGAERPHLRIAFADGYRKAGNTRKMLYHLGIASNLLPKDTQLRQQVIHGYKQLEDIDAALAACRDWAKFDPQNIEVYREMGDLFQFVGRTEEALLAWATMAEIRPREAEGYRAYAQKLTQLSKYDAAAVALRHAIRYRPTEYDISKELADVYTKLGQSERIPGLWTAGETACRKAMEDFADDPLSWLNLGRFLGAQNKTQEARDLYGTILQRQWPRFQRETHDDARKRLQEMK